MGLGVAAVVAALCAGGMVSAINGAGPARQAAPLLSTTPGQVSTQAAAAPVEETTAAAPPPAPPRPRVLLRVKGNGIKRTARFTTGDEWTLAYTFDCRGFGGSGNFIVDVLSAEGDEEDLPVNALASHGADSVPEYNAPGTHYLEVNSECAWTVTVTGIPG